MKTFRRLLALVLALACAVCLFACGEKCNHADADGDGLCDECEKVLIDPVVLIDEGEAKFAIVLGTDIPVSVRLAANQLKTSLKKIGIEIEVVDDGDETNADAEVLVGTVESRGEEYKFDKYSLGIEGYTVRIIGGNVIIAGGSDEALEDAFTAFVEDVLSFDEYTEELTDVAMDASKVITEIFTDYDVTSVKIGEGELVGYSITTDFTNAELYTAALELQSELYRKAGLFLPFVTEDAADAKVIHIRSVEKDTTKNDSFRVYEEGGTLYIVSEYSNVLAQKARAFTANFVTKAEGEISFVNNTKTGCIYQEDVSFVTYEMFGANGRDTKNDFEAIYKTHEFANISGQTVKATNGATYYISDTRIGGRAVSVSICTNVDWGTAKFEIIDTDLWAGDGTGMYGKNIFTVEPEWAAYTLSAEQIAKINEHKVGRESTKLNLSLPYGAMLNVYNENKKVYIRYGYNGMDANSGNEQHEIVLVDKDGNIDQSTPFLLDYDTVTKVEVYSIEDEALTISGGIFYTRASEVDTSLDDGTVYNQYFKRGLSVQRSNTTVMNVEHYVTGQFTKQQTDEHGLRNAPSDGFFGFRYANNVKLYNCVVTARRGHGTYDMGANTSCNVTFEKCTQSNFFLEDGFTPSTTNDEYWGVAATNFCKNLIYKDSKLTRYDAHAGVYNGAIINCEIALINITGGGTLLIEDTVIHNERVINCRRDYGATWNGEIIIRNCTLNTTSTTPYICFASWTNHDYGYVCHYPSIEVDNLQLVGTAVTRIYLEKPSAPNDPPSPEIKRHSYITYEPNIHKEGELSTGEINVNPYAPPEYVIVKNSGKYTFYIPGSLVEAGGFFENTTVEGFEYE